MPRSEPRADAAIVIPPHLNAVEPNGEKPTPRPSKAHLSNRRAMVGDEFRRKSATIRGMASLKSQIRRRTQTSSWL